MTNNEPHNSQDADRTSMWVVKHGSSERTNIVYSHGRNVYSSEAPKQTDAGDGSTPKQSEENQSHTPSDQFEQVASEPGGGEYSLEQVSTYWRPAISCVFFGLLSFIIGLGGVIGYLSTLHMNWTYVIAVSGAFYALLRCGGGYFIHKDAVLIRQYSRAYSSTPHREYSWTPKAALWGACAVVVPPGGEIGLIAGYIYRRHQELAAP